MNELIKSNELKIKHLFKTGVAFGFSKGAVLIVPVFLSNVLSNSDYGLFEACLAYGSILAVILGAGVPAAVPYFMLSRKTHELNGLFYIHAVFCVVFLVITIVAASFFGMPVAVVMTLFFAVLISGQRIFSADMKARSYAATASFAESFLYVAILLVILFGGIQLNFSYLLESTFSVVFPVVIVGLIFAFRVYTLPNKYMVAARELYSYSIPTIIPSLLLLSITSLIRLIAPFFVGTDKLAIYSFYFRFASVAVVVYQFLATVYFAKLYASHARDLDKIFFSIALLILLLAFLGLLFFPIIFASSLKLFATFENYWVLYLLLVYFCLFWVSQAMLEAIIFRERLARGFMWLQFKVLAGFLTICTVLYLGLLGQISIILLTYLHTLLMAVLVMSQLKLLKEKDVEFPIFQKLNQISFFVVLVGYPIMSVLL